MFNIKAMIEAKGYIVSESRSATARMRLLEQASTMLEKLAKMKTADDMNTAGTNQNWWSPQPREDQRRVTMRYGGAVVPDTGIYVPNNLAAVTKAIKDFKDIIEQTTDADWVAEEERRERARAEAVSKKKKKSS